MQTALRKMGNLVGLIVPKAILKELGASAGTAMDVRVEDGQVVAKPVAHPRAGWAEAAAMVAAAEPDPDEEVWSAFDDEDNDEWVWEDANHEERRCLASAAGPDSRNRNSENPTLPDHLTR